MIKKIVGFKVLVLPLSLALAVMLVVLFIKPVFSDMIAARKAVEENRRQLAGLQDQNAKLLALKSKWETMDEDRKQVQNALPEGQDIDNYMDELYGRVTRSGIFLEKFDVQKSSLSSQASICGEEAAGASAEIAPQTGVNTAASSDNTAFSGTATLPNVSRPCVNATDVRISASGNWEQLLNLLNYLGDTNRIANLKILNISLAGAGQQEGESSDVLSLEMTLQIFDKAKGGVSDIGTINTLASQGTFSEEIISKLKNVVYSVYEEPSVSETGERNLFK